MILRTLHLSLAEYDAMVLKGAFDDLNRRVELIRGEVVEMNPAGPLHDDYITYLTNWSSDSRDKRVTQITSQTGIDMPQVQSRPEPDVFWVRRARYRDSHPQATDVQLAIEVADSSLEKDLEIKRHLYAEVGIVEYWIVDCQNRCVHVFRDPEGTDYRTHRIASGSETISPLVAPDARLELHDLFVGES
jgi:Uma2 family endonuclease